MRGAIFFLFLFCNGSVVSALRWIGMVDEGDEGRRMGERE